MFIPGAAEPVPMLGTRARKWTLSFLSRNLDSAGNVGAGKTINKQANVRGKVMQAITTCCPSGRVNGTSLSRDLRGTLQTNPWILGGRGFQAEERARVK